MTTQMRVFDFDAQSVQVVDRAGEPWFVAKGLCAILGIQNASDAMGRLDEDERGIVSNDTLSGIQDMLIVSESGMYSLVLGSRKPIAI